jgi:hypothetical protein
MTDKNLRLTLGDLKKIISEVMQEADPPPGAVGDPIGKKKKDRSSKEKTDQRKVIDAVRVAISDAVTEDVRKNVHQALQQKGLIKYRDIEIISEPPKTLIRLMDIDGVSGQDMIYLVNVTKIV